MRHCQMSSSINFVYITLLNTTVLTTPSTMVHVDDVNAFVHDNKTQHTQVLDVIYLKRLSNSSALNRSTLHQGILSNVKNALFNNAMYKLRKQCKTFRRNLILTSFLSLSENEIKFFKNKIQLGKKVLGNKSGAVS